MQQKQVAAIKKRIAAFDNVQHHQTPVMVIPVQVRTPSPERPWEWGNWKQGYIVPNPNR